MDERDPQKKIEGMTRIVLRPLVSPLPLAFFAFGAGSLMLSGLQLGLIPASETRSVALVQAAFVFPPLAVAAILAFLTREGLGATALGLISFSWLSTAIILYASPPPATSNVLGVLSLIVAVILLLLGITAVFGKPILAGFILLAVARYSLNGIYELTEMAGAQTASGYLGLVIFAASLYGGLAFGLEDVQHKTVLPLGRRGEALQAFEGDLSEQVGPVEQEAGVRKQL